MYGLRSKETKDPDTASQMDSDILEMLHAVGATKHEDVSVSCVDLKKLINKIDGMNSEFKSIKKSLKTLKDGQDQIMTISATATQALQLAEKNNKSLADLELRIGVLEQNQESIPELEIKVDNLLKQVENRVTSDLEAKIKHLEKQLHDANEEASDAKTNVLTLTESLNEVTKNCSNIDNYLRRDNLLFHNVKESKDENCFQVIRDLMAKMGIENARQLPIVRCHRLKGSRNPPIICRFHFYGDRQQVFENRFKLKGTRVFIEEHFPDEVI
jgi:chromosome segregation ATPase